MKVVVRWSSERLGREPRAHIEEADTREERNQVANQSVNRFSIARPT
jgi:hypothetical protein